MSAERYWEARWRDEKAENERLRKEIEQLRADIDAYLNTIGRLTTENERLQDIIDSLFAAFNSSSAAISSTCDRVARMTKNPSLSVRVVTCQGCGRAIAWHTLHTLKIASDGSYWHDDCWREHERQIQPCDQ